MQFDSLPLRYKFCIFSLGLILLTWLFATFVVFPYQRRISDLESQLQAERRLVETAQEFAATQPEPAKYLKQLDDKLYILAQMLPSEARISEFLFQGEAAAKASSVQLLSLKPGAAVNKNGYQEWMMEIVISGSFFQTMNFIKTMEASPRFNSLSSIVMQVKSGQLVSKLIVSIYSFSVQLPSNSAQ